MALLSTLLAQAAVAADNPAEPVAQFAPQAAEASAAEMLSSARYALAELELEQGELHRRIAFSQAITALTGLYQLHGCSWALPRLIELYARPGCPDLHVGYSADGRLLLRVEKLELRNPAFREYAIYLCTFESNSALDLTAEFADLLRFEIADIFFQQAQRVQEGHPLWPQLKRLAGNFEPVPVVYSGTGTSFKQVFALDSSLPGVDSPSGMVSAVSLDWGSYTIEIPFYETEVPRD